MKLLAAIALVAATAVAGSARADQAKPAPPSLKLPASARVFVIDKDAPPTEKTQPLARVRPALKSKS